MGVNPPHAYRIGILWGTPEGPLGNGDPLEGGLEAKKGDPRRSYKGGLHYIAFFTVHFPKAILLAEPKQSLDVAIGRVKI